MLTIKKLTEMRFSPALTHEGGSSLEGKSMTFDDTGPQLRARSLRGEYSMG